MNIIVNARKESRDSDKFICKTNDDVNEWMDEFYVDGRDASFNLHCLWAWQEQERRHGSLIAEIESLKKDAARYRWLRDESIDPGAVIDKNVGIFNSEDGGYPIWEYRAGKELDDAIDTAMIEVNNK